MLAGTRIAGRFLIDDEAGQGATGTVFRAVDDETGERVAVKVVLTADPSHDARFLREVQVAAQLRHPGLARYVAHGVTERGEHYLAMEWLEGEDLRARLKRGALSIHECVTLGRRVAEVLAVVHGAGLVHRDIKPGNIFLCGGSVDRVKLIDFGLARPLTAANALTLTGMAVGTPAYMAPEQARGARDLDARADLFSLGSVLYRCLTGRSPFAGSHAVEVMTKVLLEDPASISELRPGVPGALVDLVRRLLEKDPERRPRTARDVAAALDRIPTSPDDGAPQPAPPSVPASRALTAGERRVLSVLLLAADEAAAQGEGAAPHPMIEGLIQEHDGRLERLADGTRVVTLAGALAPADQAESAARCALSLRAVLPGAPMALATGSAEIARRLPVGGVIERAAALLAASVAAAADAARERRAPPAWIAIDDETAALVDARFEVRPTATGLGLVRPREGGFGSRSLLGKPTSMVGRDWELSGISQLFRECVEAQAAQAVVVMGPAGMGKSRLARELVAAFRALEPEVQIWAGRGEPARARSALGLLGQALRGAAGIHEGEPLEVRRRKVAERVGRHAPPALAPRWADLLAELVGAPPDDASPALRAARADPRVMSEQMSRAWEGFLNAESAAHPVVLVLEDLQWGDPSTVRFVDAALGALGHRPWMVLALGRPELGQLFPDLWQRRSAQVFRLAPLAHRASAALVRQVLGAAADAATCERIASRAAGNAFYLEELIRSVAQGKAAGGALPETLLAMVQGRLADLDAEPRRILRAASVFGEAFWPGGVAALLGGSTSWSLGPWLEALAAQEILVRRPESRFEGEPELSFRHALLREGAYAMLTEEDRALGHRLAGEWLEQRGERDPAVLAEHFERGGEPARAAVHHLRAAQQALRGGDTDAAMAMARRGLDGGAPDAARVALLALLCEAHSWRDEWPKAAEYGEDAIRLSAPGSAPWATGLRAKLGEALRQDDLRGFLEHVRTLEGADPSPEAASAVVLALATATFILDWNCLFTEAARRSARMGEIVEKVAAGDPMARGWLHMSRSMRCAIATGEPWLGIELAGKAQEAFKEANHSRGVLLTHFSVGGNAWALGALHPAERALDATEGAEEEFALGSSLRVIFRSHVCALRGRYDVAKLGPRRLIERARARGSARYEGQARLALGEILWREGEIEGAAREVALALDLPQLMPLDRMHGAALSAAVHLAAGRTARALGAAEQAMALHLEHDGHGWRPAFARLVHAEALHASGDEAGAHRAIREARAVLLARAAKIADPGLRAGFLENVPENARTLALAEAWLGPIGGAAANERDTSGSGGGGRRERGPEG